VRETEAHFQYEHTYVIMGPVARWAAEDGSARQPPMSESALSAKVLGNIWSGSISRHQVSALFSIWTDRPGDGLTQPNRVFQHHPTVVTSPPCRLTSLSLPFAVLSTISARSNLAISLSIECIRGA
jgi:hypothetical protein